MSQGSVSTSTSYQSLVEGIARSVLPQGDEHFDDLVKHLTTAVNLISPQMESDALDTNPDRGPLV